MRYLHDYHPAAPAIPCKLGMALHGRFYVDDGFGNLVEVEPGKALSSFFGTFE